ncbi:unnamed protein product [Gordionus sp. m RMFG-2023]
MYQTNMMQLSNMPVPMICPNCGMQIVSRVREVDSTCCAPTGASTGICLCCIPIPGCFCPVPIPIPCASPCGCGGQSTFEHSCPACGYIIGNSTVPY